MRTALDTNILSAIWSGEESAAVISEQLKSLRRSGTLVIAPVVYAELFAHPSATKQFMEEFFADTGIQIDYNLNKSIWFEAGSWYSQYADRRRKVVREGPLRLLADFLIGGHALLYADQVMTFDTNRFRHDFPEVLLIRPVAR